MKANAPCSRLTLATSTPPRVSFSGCSITLGLPPSGISSIIICSPRADTSAPKKPASRYTCNIPTTTTASRSSTAATKKPRASPSPRNSTTRLSTSDFRSKRRLMWMPTASRKPSRFPPNLSAPRRRPISSSCNCNPATEKSSARISTGSQPKRTPTNGPRPPTASPVSSYEDLTALQSLAKVSVDVSASMLPGPDGPVAHVLLKNPSDHLAFQLHLGIHKSGQSEDILPVFWDDNYIELMPGESRELTARYLPSSSVFGGSELTISGWNIAPATIPLKEARGVPASSTGAGH